MENVCQMTFSLHFWPPVGTGTVLGKLLAVGQHRAGGGGGGGWSGGGVGQTQGRTVKLCTHSWGQFGRKDLEGPAELMLHLLGTRSQ